MEGDRRWYRKGFILEILLPGFYYLAFWKTGLMAKMKICQYKEPWLQVTARLPHLSSMRVLTSQEPGTTLGSRTLDLVAFPGGACEWEALDKCTKLDSRRM